MRSLESPRHCRPDDCRQHIQSPRRQPIQIRTPSSETALIGRERFLKKNKMHIVMETDYDSSPTTFLPSRASAGGVTLQHSAPLILARPGTDCSSSTCMHRGHLAACKRPPLRPQSNRPRLALRTTILNDLKDRVGPIRADQILCGGVGISLPCRLLQACQ